MAYLTLFFILISILGGTLSYRASTALPDDIWYPYKLEVNERIESFVANTDEAQIRLNLSLLKSRLSEARILARHGRLDAYAENKVSTNIQLHINNILTLIEKLQLAEDFQQASLVSNRLHHTLTIESEILADVSSQGSFNLQISLAPILTRLRTATATTALVATKASVKASQVKNSSTESVATLTPSKLSLPEVQTKKKDEVQLLNRQN